MRNARCFSVGTTGRTLLPCVFQDFQKIVVHGKPKEPERSHRAVFKPPSDVHLPTARLRLVCFDKTTGGMPLPPLPTAYIAIWGWRKL